MGIQRPRDHARRERGEVLPQAPREREARETRSFPPRRRTLRRRNRDRQRASIQKTTWHRSGATDRTTELVAGTGAGSSVPAMSAPSAAELGRLLAAADNYRVVAVDGTQVGWLDHVRSSAMPTIPMRLSFGRAAELGVRFKREP